jgi:hypothetical protein
MSQEWPLGTGIARMNDERKLGKDEKGKKITGYSEAGRWKKSGKKEENEDAGRRGEPGIQPCTRMTILGESI